QRDRNTAFPVRCLSEERQYVIGQFPKKDLINELRLDNPRLAIADLGRQTLTLSNRVEPCPPTFRFQR
ncbi:hypothetical protein, partial [Aurantimonas sp. C2-4-R8]|nr:hypothetical protein [Aurantimonas sp. C2-4-R8]